uniref:SWIM-type domain-containing protein n=1 Tax=Branchiostoma floridae TaxID=7739 RepID=C3YMW3_BRAFL|eukprot:XP_002602442.1 hypothetical protein BRAFLDRAFT_117021 [Branchiostoma floridae]
MDDHRNHPTVGMVAELSQPVDDRIRQQVVKVTVGGAKSVTEVKHHLNTFITNELFRGETPPPPTQRKYYPTDRDLWNIMATVKDSTRNSSQDQANVQILSTRWALQEDCKVKFRPSEVHEDERTVDIREALQVFKEWNPEWNPSHFMVDFCEAEIGALEEEFQDAKVLLCDFHREKAWVEWVRKKDHGVSHVQATVLDLLRDIAAAATTEEYERCLSLLRESEVWKENERLRAWFSNKWLDDKCTKRWVQAFKDEDLKVAIYTNNGVERQNETLKYSHLDGRKRRSLTEMLTVVVTDFLPTAYRKYIQLNVAFSSCYRKYHTDLPTYLKDRPRGVVLHIMARLQEAQSYEQDDIVSIGPGIFQVKSSSKRGQQHTVNFGATSTNMPSCTCRDWLKHKLPCKHFCSVFNLQQEWGWEKLSAVYRDNPLFSLDSTLLSSSSSTCTSSEMDEMDDSSSPSLTSTADPPPPSPTPSPAVYGELPVNKPKRTKQLQRECASLLKEMTNITYNLQDELYLTSMKEQLSCMLEEMMGHSAHDGNFRVRSPRKGKRKMTDSHALPTLPPKHPSSNRVGRRADMMKSTFQVNYSLNAKEKAPELEVSVVECDDLQAMVGVETEAVIGVETEAVIGVETEAVIGVETETVIGVETEAVIGVETEAVLDCDEAQNEWLVINNTKLTQKDREILQEDQWLNDKHMNSAQHLISSEYPLIDGLRDTVILTANQQGPVPASSDCVQIHNINDHWVVSTSIGGNITVYDSLQPSMKPELRSQLADLYRQFAIGEDSIIPVNVICAQRQQGGNDCGLYAVANAVALVEEIPPTQIVFQQGQMRHHFEECLENKAIKMFPHDTKVGQANTVSVSYQLTTYCCHEHRPGSPMIMCDKCAQWYHYSCVNLRDNEVYALVTQQEDYVCPTCHSD